MKHWTGLACAFAVLAIAGAAHAQNYPTHDVKMIVPFPAGGPSDTVARIVAEGMSRHLGQQVVVENVGGAGGTLGATRASEAAPDGYTIMAASMGTVIAAPSFYPISESTNSTKDFEPIGMTANAPAAIAIKASIPAKNVKEFVEWAKKKGPNVKQAFGGVGGTSHMACLLFNKIFDLKPTAVLPIEAQARPDHLTAGHVDDLRRQVVSMVGPMQTGKSRNPCRHRTRASHRFPQCRAPKKAGAMTMVAVECASERGLRTAGTPHEIVGEACGRARQNIGRARDSREARKLGGTVPPKSERGPEYLRKTVASDIPRWAPILKEAAETTKAN